MAPRSNTATIDRLKHFAGVLLRWNARVNLIASHDEPALWRRHIEDCLQLAPLIPPGTSRATDLGSGAGFPGLVLAIATGIRFDLIEADQRKASFLRTAVLETGAPARVHACRIEATDIPPAPLVTARALAPLSRLLPLAAPLVAQDGVCLFLKGARAAEEVAEASGSWDMSVTTTRSETSDEGVILGIRGLRRKHAR